MEQLELDFGDERNMAVLLDEATNAFYGKYVAGTEQCFFTSNFVCAAFRAGWDAAVKATTAREK